MMEKILPMLKNMRNTSPIKFYQRNENIKYVI